MKTYTKQIEKLSEAIRRSDTRPERTVWYLVAQMRAILESATAKGTERDHAKWLLRRMHQAVTGDETRL